MLVCFQQKTLYYGAGQVRVCCVLIVVPEVFLRVLRQGAQGFRIPENPTNNKKNYKCFCIQSNLFH